MARATLLMVLNLLLFLAFWIGGRALSGNAGGEELHFSGFVISFRARVTLALFGFFVLAIALFGTIAYRTLAQASVRSAQAIAERVVEDAADWYLSLAGATGETPMERLAQQVGAELLEYKDGELREEVRRAKGISRVFAQHCLENLPFLSAEFRTATAPQLLRDVGLSKDLERLAKVGFTIS